jgi:hypothetical protein
MVPVDNVWLDFPQKAMDPLSIDLMESECAELFWNGSEEMKYDTVIFHDGVARDRGVTNHNMEFNVLMFGQTGG